MYDKKGERLMEEKNKVVIPRKPTSMIIKETKDKLVEILNTSALPPFVLEPIMKDLYTEVVGLSQQQYLQEKTEYEKALKECETTQESSDNN